MVTEASGAGLGGGIATAALAVVLGTKIYQDSLREESNLREIDQMVPAEAPGPAPRSTPASPPPLPSITEEEQKNKEKAHPKIGMAKNEALSDKTTTAKDPQEPPTSQKVTREPQSPTAMKEEMRRSTPAPTPGVAKPKPMMPSAAAPQSEIRADRRDARALFYADAPSRRERQALAKERRLRSADDTPAGARPEAVMKPSSDTGLTDRPEARQFQPLGLRYGFLVKGRDGQDHEVDAVTAAHSGGQARLTVECNQDGDLQILRPTGSLVPQLFFPAGETARPFFRLIGGNRIDIPLPPGDGERRIIPTVRLSREPFEAGREQEAISPGYPSPPLLTESVSAAGPTDREEQAVYVVSQDRSASAQIVVSIQIGR